MRPALGRPFRRRRRRRPARPLVTAPLDAHPHLRRIEARIVAARLEHHRGADWLGPELGVPARTVSRVLRRHDLPRLCTLHPLTGQPIRATRHTTKRYERERPGKLVPVDVQKIARIPDGGGWRAHGRRMGST
ncbi:MAG TPA: hypothetical protein VHL09_09200 [Dehalococcoidia bacterium]|nr:hypothetical protein [Dehalococcoidia bacterium]